MLLSAWALDTSRHVRHVRNNGRRSQGSQGSNGEPLPPLRAPAGKYAPAAHGLHALPEAVAPLAHDVAWLIGPFHASPPLPALSAPEPSQAPGPPLYKRATHLTRARRLPLARLGACAVEVLMLGDWRAAAGEVGSWPECGHLAGPTRGWKSHTGRPEQIRVSYAVDGHCAPRSKCVGRPAPASARGHRPHPLDVQRQAHEVPLAARQASQAESSESEHLRSAPPRATCVARTGLCPRGSPVSHPCGAWQGAGPGRPPPGTCLHAPALRARRCRDLPAPTDPARCSSPHRPVPPQARPQTSR